MGGKRGKQKKETDETMAVEPMATDETSITVDDMKENGIENGAKLDTVSSKKHLAKPTVRRQFLKKYIITVYIGQGRNQDLGIVARKFIK